jgi:hypothetical protein
MTLASTEGTKKSFTGFFSVPNSALLLVQAEVKRLKQTHSNTFIVLNIINSP